MPIPQLPGILNDPNATLNDLVQAIREYQIRLDRELQFMMQNGIDSTNIFEVGGWRIKPYQFAYKDNMVGMSSSGVSGTSIRFWAGNANPAIAPFRVQHDGTIYSTKGFIGGFIIGANTLTDTAGTFGFSSLITAGNDIRFWAGNVDPLQGNFQLYENGDTTIIGGTIRTGAVGTNRIELSGNQLKTYNASDQLSGLVLGPSDAGYSYGDMFLYDSGVKVLEFFNRLTGSGYSIRPVGSASFGLGSAGKITNANGDWTFSGSTSFTNTISGSITGNAATANYASNAGSAAAADSLAPSGNIAWGQVLKSGSNVADLATKNLSSMTDDSTHRTVTDTEKSTWNAKAPTASPTFTVAATLPAATTIGTITAAELAFVHGVTSAIQTQLDGKASKTLPSWVAPTFAGTWVNYGGSEATAGYYKDDMSIVRMKGLIKSGTIGTIPFTLPVGYRPAETIRLGSISNGSFCYIVIGADGTVTIATGDNTWVSLANISFRAEQ